MSHSTIQPSAVLHHHRSFVFRSAAFRTFLASVYAGSALGLFAAEKTAVISEDVPRLSLQRSLVIGGQGYFPVALRLADGRIAVVLRGGGGHLSIKGRLDMVFSGDEGKTWTKPVVVVDSPADDRNPSLGQAKDGALVVGFWRTETYDEKGRYNPKLDKPRSTWATRSSDGGTTWSEPLQIDVSDIFLGSPFGRIVTLPEGTMLMGIYGYDIRPPGAKSGGTRNHSYVYQSKDDGRNWNRISEIGDGRQQLNETSLLRLPDGKLLAAIRSRAGEVWVSSSTDAGFTWSKTRQISPVNGHPGDLCLLPDGKVLLTVGNRIGPFGVVGIVGTRAGEFDWAKRFTLVDDASSRDCGYPSSIALKDGRVLTLYYATKVKEHAAWKVHCGAVFYRVP